MNALQATAASIGNNKGSGINSYKSQTISQIFSRFKKRPDGNLCANMSLWT